MKFTEENGAHEILRDLMKQRFVGNDEKTSAEDISRVVTREDVLDLISQAQNASMAENDE